MLTEMNLDKKIKNDIKSAMLAKDKLRLEVCRSIKSAILILKTEKDGGEINHEKEVKILQKLLKQRIESAKIFSSQGRVDLAKHEQMQADIIKEYLPEKLSIEELDNIIDSVISSTGLSSKKDMGRLMLEVTKKCLGSADGKTISSILLSKLK
tara:strand:- start:324 stop:782 length:459 start_codon:yes stop_codon:yes gene_type:complete